MVRLGLAVLAGLFAGGLTVALVEAISSLLHPAPPGLDFHDAAALARFVATLPTSAFLCVIVAHFCGTLIAGLVTCLIAKRPWWTAAIGIGLVFQLAGVANLIMIPHPTWVAVADMMVYVPGAILGVWIYRRAFVGHALRA